ncbi:MAG: TrmH family RNA methyltransferase [Xenococcaceae cyanobacterium]
MKDANSSCNEILSVESTLVKIEKLQRDRRYRDACKLFYIEGVKNFVRAIDNNFELVTIIYSEKLLTAPLARKLVRQSRRAGTYTLSVTPEQFRRISKTEKASGIGAIVRQRWFGLHNVLPNAGLCWIVLETVRNTGNLGTLIRTSEALGGAGFILVGTSIDPYDPNIVRPSMSAIFRQKLIRTNFDRLQNWMRRHHCQAIGASSDGTIAIDRFKYPQSTILFLGEERQGLTQKQRDLCQSLVKIPMIGEADSLNLAVAGSLMMYEVYRSRRK